MPRQTKSEISAEILDCAAGLFARHGFARASLQQIADALNYSKAGLLHHHRSKKALFEAVLDEYESRTRRRIADVSKFPVGIARDRAFIDNAIEYSFTWPGMAALGHQLAREGLGDDPRFVELGFLLIDALGIDTAAPDMERMIRAFSALGGASFTARLAVTMKMERECRDHIAAAAMDALGHHDDATARNHSS